MPSAFHQHERPPAVAPAAKHARAAPGSGPSQPPIAEETQEGEGQEGEGAQEGEGTTLGIALTRSGVSDLLGDMSCEQADEMAKFTKATEARAGTPGAVYDSGVETDTDWDLASVTSESSAAAGHSEWGFLKVAPTDIGETES